MLPNCFRFLFVGLAFLCSSDVSLAWSHRIHVSVTEQAFKALNKQERQYYHQLLSGLGYNVENLGRIGLWADRVRNKPLVDVFLEHGTSVPHGLKKVKHYSTGKWHYFNYAYPKRSRCNVELGGYLIDALNRLDRTLHSNIDDRQTAITLAFTIHLIQDAHQPLHSVTYVNENCAHDRGGNDFCLEKKGNRCQLNLHQLWDRGFLDADKNLADNKINSKNKSKVLNKKLRFNPSVWVKESSLYADDVYQIKLADFTPEYVKRSRKITKAQTTLMLNRLTQYLKNYYTWKHNE